MNSLLNFKDCFKQFLFLAMVVVPLVYVGGCATVPRGQGGMSSATILKTLCEENHIAWVWDSVSRVATLTYNDKSAKILVDSPLVLIGEDKIILEGSVKIVRSSIVVPVDFKLKVIDRLIEKKEIVLKDKVKSSSRVLKEVIIDPGHGGKDPGALGTKGTKEKHVVLDVSRRLKRILERHGIRVRMTRSKDEFISLQERTEIAARSKADLFVSIHANSSPVRSVVGFEIYSLKDLDYRGKNESQRMSNMDLMFNHLNMRKKDHNLNKVLDDMLFVNKLSQERKLASSISNKMPVLADVKSRGHKYSHFFVLRNTLIPAVLVELGYLTNTQEEKRLRNSLYQQKLAEALSKCILEYVKK